MTQPKVSIIVPVYNTEKYLRRCVDSMVKQTMQDLEIILVDDGSREPCAKLCDELAELDARIKVIHKVNAGAGFARNTGLEVAAGEYIGFVDSDDYIEPEMYENLYEAAVRYDADLVLSGTCFVGGNTFSKENEYLSKPCFEKDTVFEKEDIQNLLLGVVGALPHEPDDSRYGVGVWKNIFRHALIQERGISFLSERTIMSEDTLFMIDFIKQTDRAVGIPGAYYCYCRNEDSFSKSYNSTRFEKNIVFFKELEKHIADAVPKETYKIYLDRLTQGYARVLCSQEVAHARDQKIPYRTLRKQLKKICTEERLKNVLKSYPWYRLPVKQAVFAFAMKYRLYFLQKIMVLLRDR